ncbi:MAG TPA: adenylate/guanylate cyclase domain-containing protein, partial [Dokdonella sp.]
MSSDQHQLEAGIAALEAQRALLGPAVVDASIKALRAQLATLRSADSAKPPEASQALRQVSILFLDVVGSTTLSQRLDPEAIGDVMDGALSRGTAIVAGHHGQVLQYAGDNLLAVFGAEQSREDDAERAVRCGLALLALGKELGREVQAAHGHAGFDVRVGIHTGGVLLGGGVDEDGSIRGMSVNIAARMEQTAPAGALRISKDTYTQVRGVFDVVPQEPLVVKGVDAPVASYLVERLKPRAFRVETRGIEGVATRMIGRDAELEVLQDAFKRLVKAGAGLERVIVVADAGVGKSRLLYEFRNWAEAREESFFVFQARATSQTQGQAYGLLRDLLAWRFEIGDGDAMDVAKAKLEAGIAPLFEQDEGAMEAEAHAHLLGQLIGLDYADSPHVRGIREDGRQIRNRGFHAAAEALRRIAARGTPLVVFLDDLHWADDPSLDFIDYLAQVNRDVPMLLIALTRPTLFERRSGETMTMRRVDLHPLDKGHSRDLANELLKRLPEIPAAVRELITGGADGNPFYMEELVKMLIDQGGIVTSGDRWSVDADKLLAVKVPPTLTGVLQARLDGLPPIERHALQLASVIGQTFWDAALAHVETDAETKLPRLTERELVNRKDGTDRSDDIREYAFRHQILHQVTYDTVLKRVRRDAHAKTAQWLAGLSGSRAKALLGTAAEHYERAGDAANAAEFYAQAAKHAASTFANEALLDYTTRALALAPADAHALRWRLYEVREFTLALIGQRPAQRDDLAAMTALAEALDDDGRRAHATMRQAVLAVRTGDYASSEAEGRRAIALAMQAGAEELALRATQTVAVAMAYRGDAVAGRALVDTAMVRAQQLDLPAAQAKLANAGTICAEFQGDLMGSLQYARLGVEVNRRIGDGRGETFALSNAGNASLQLGDLDGAREHLQLALTRSRAMGARLLLGEVLTSLSALTRQRGDDALALTHAEAAVEILTELGAHVQLGDALVNLAEAELALGRYAASADALDRCDAVVGIDPRPGVRVNLLEMRVRLALARGDLEQARNFAERLATEIGFASSIAPDSFEGTTTSLDDLEEAKRHLTLHRVWTRSADPRADEALRQAHHALMRIADTITDATFRQSYLNNLVEHREIMALWA